MSRCLVTATNGAGFDVVADILAHLRPSIVPSDQFQGAVLAKMSSENVVMVVLKDTETEILGVWDIDAIIKAKDV